MIGVICDLTESNVWTELDLRTLTRAGSLGKLKNLFCGLLKTPLLTAATRFGHPETTHFTMLVVSSPPRPDRRDEAVHVKPARNGHGPPETRPERREICLCRTGNVDLATRKLTDGAPDSASYSAIFCRI